MAQATASPARVELVLERWIARGFNAIAANPIRYAIATILGGLIIGGTIFSIAEAETGWFDGIWWAFVSMTTVGYGDIAPKTTGIRMLATFVIASGIAATAILTAALAGRIAEARLSAKGLTLDLDNEFDEVAARLQSLKERYQHDERHDDMLIRRATLLVEAWELKDEDFDGVHHAMGELQACLAIHPEREEFQRGAP